MSKAIALYRFKILTHLFRKISLKHLSDTFQVNRTCRVMVPMSGSEFFLVLKLLDSPCLIHLSKKRLDRVSCCVKMKKRLNDKAMKKSSEVITKAL